MLVDDSPRIGFSCWLSCICSLVVLYLLFIRWLVIVVSLMVVDLTRVGGAMLLSKWNQDSKLSSASISRIIDPNVPRTQEVD